MGRKNGRTACTEENELLNSNAIKMSDAPFGRSDSEDDIIEDYDDVVNFKGTCCKDRTALERLLLVLIVLLIVVVVGLAVGLTRPEIIPRKDYCKSTQCVQAASTIMAAMDPEADPCQDFFQYACGGWVRQNPIPKGYHKWDRSQELSGQNLYVLKRYLDSDVPLKGKAENKTRTFYRTCIASQKASRQATLQRLLDLVKGVGGWSVSTATQKWHIDTALQRIHRLGAWPLFRIKVDVDERDPTRRYIVKIDLGETVVPTDMYPPLNVPSPPPSTPNPTPRPDTTTANNNNNSDSEQITGMTMPTTPSTTPTTTTTEDPAKVVDRVKKLFVEETVYIMQALGFNSTAARQRARLMADLEHKIAAATEGKAHIHDRFSLYNVLTVGELEANFSMFSWTQYFAVLGLNVNPEDEVVVFHPGYLANLTALISAAQNSPDQKNVLRDYMVVTLVRSFKQYFDPALFDMEELEADSMQEPWKRCTFYTNKALGFATGAIFVRGTGQEGNVDEIQRLISYVRAAFKEFILRKFWIDTKTRLKAEEKVDSIINKISYPGYIMNTSFLDNFYQKFTVSPDNWFDNILNWRTFDRQRANIELMSIPDRQKRTSAAGRQYDAEGRLKDWWDPHSTESFGITTQCMVDQYNNIQVKGNDVDGDFTLDENIADNGGLRAAHYAFMKWLEEVGEEAPLPSLNMTHHQVFFLSYAQMYCSKWTDMGLKLHLLTDPHSPGAARVNGVLANSKTFSWAFQCPVYSTMNAQTKCEVW